MLGDVPVAWPIPLIDSAIMDSLTAAMDSTLGDTTLGRAANNGGNIPALTNVNRDAAPSFTVFPNPTSGNFTIQATGAGKFVLYNLLGQQLQQYMVAAGTTELRLPANLPAGIYTGLFKAENNKMIKEVKLVYQP